MDTEEKSTKDKIIDAAFSLFEVNAFTKFSLSKIAKKVGISKAAIYRHFASKEELLNSMKEIVYEKLYSFFKEVSAVTLNENLKEIIKTVVRYMVDYGNYMNFYIRNTIDFSQDDLIQNMRKNEECIFDSFIDKDGNILKIDFYFKNLFIIGALLIFVNSFLKSESSGESGGKGKTEAEKEKFIENLSDFMVNGIGERHTLSADRMNEIDEICRKSLENFDEPDRIVLALSSAVRKNGFFNTTVESIANELGMAKSSLYSWFDNLGQLKLKIIEGEFESIFKTFVANYVLFEAEDERLYALLSTEFSYFIKRREVLDLCIWVQFQDPPDLKAADVKFKNAKQFKKLINEIPLFKKNGSMDFMDDDSYTSMIFIIFIPLFILLHGRLHEFKDEVLYEALKNIFYMILGGVDYETLSENR